MSTPIPTTEPRRVTAGETITWTKTLPLYPAGAGNTLKYALQSYSGQLISIEANADGNDYSVTIDETTSAAWIPGVYTWTAFIENNGTRTVFARGTISILPSPLAAFGSTHAQRMLGLIESALEGRIPNNLQSYDIDGQRIDKIPVPQLKRMRDEYLAEVKLERDGLANAMGQKRRCSIGIRFSSS